MQLEAETYKDYLTRLRKLNLKYLGSGAFGMVYQHPEFSNVAVKVVRDDRKYMNFTKFAIENPSNPYLPRIAAVDKVKFDNGSSGYIVFMEALVAASRRSIDDFFNQVSRDLHISDDVEHRLSKAGWELLGNSRNPNLATLATYMLKNWSSLDLGNQNLMQRGRQLVFVDPVA